MKRRSMGSQKRAGRSAYHRKGKRPYQYPAWVNTGRDLPEEIAKLVERSRRQQHGDRHADI